jgi:hypothetical protein
MKAMRLLILFFGIFCGTEALAQLTKPVHRMILFNGEIITGEHLTYNCPILKPAEFVLDGISYETNTVEFFQNNHGYFANLSRQNAKSKERYAMRIQKGKINLFEEIEIDIYGSEELQVEGNSNGKDPLLASGEFFNYYSKGDEAIKKATYRNLKVDLSDNANSMYHLKQFKKYQLIQWGLIGAATGIVAANVAAQSSTGVKFNPIMAVGLVIGGSSYFLQAPKSDSMWLAADEYNKTEQPMVSNP